MTEIAALVIVTVFAAWREWTHVRAERGWMVERSSLLNRIKPETAQPLGLPEDLRSLMPEPIRTDEEYWGERTDNPFSEDVEQPFGVVDE